MGNGRVERLLGWLKGEVIYSGLLDRVGEGMKG